MREIMAIQRVDPADWRNASTVQVLTRSGRAGGIGQTSLRVFVSRAIVADTRAKLQQIIAIIAPSPTTASTFSSADSRRFYTNVRGNAVVMENAGDGRGG
jgi:hypothetical protein